jgi:Uncharacterized homolog of plant Iojap protein
MTGKVRTSTTKGEGEGLKKENRLRDFEYLYNALADKRGLDIVAMDMEGSAAISDTFVLVTAKFGNTTWAPSGMRPWKH